MQKNSVQTNLEKCALLWLRLCVSRSSEFKKQREMPDHLLIRHLNEIWEMRRKFFWNINIVTQKCKKEL